MAFTHVVDCRESAPGSPAADCSGERSGNLYLQYWFYYPGSATGEGSTPLKGAIRTASSAVGKPSHHRDDWESFQVRIEPGGRRYSRASSHHGYGPGWVTGKDRIYVAGNSAGAPLAAMMMAEDWTRHGLPCAPIAGAILVTGIYDLRAVLRIQVNEDVRLAP